MTVFDITDLARVRYCFVRHRTSWPGEFLAWMVPLSAHTYIKPYVLDSIIEKEVPSSLGEIQDCSLISTAALEDTWPNQSWKEPDDLDDLQKSTGLVPAKFDAVASIDSEGPRSLRDQAMDVLISTILSYPDSALGAVSEAEILADFNERLKKGVYDGAESLKPSVTSLGLLCTIFKHDLYVDLSPFHTLTYDDLVSLVSQLLDHGQMRQLNFSNMANLTGEDLALVLSPRPGPKLQAVFLLENPQISVESLSALGCGYELHHSGLLRHSVVGYLEEKRTGSLAFLDFSARENAVTQILWVGVTRDQSHAPDFRKPDGSMSWATLSPDNDSSMLRSRYMAERLSYNVFPLTDVPLSITRLVTGFWNFLEWSSHAKIPGTWKVPPAAASSFAIGSSSFSSHSNAPAVGVGPLSAELYIGNIILRDDNFPCSRALKPGQWAFIVIHESCDVGGEESQIRYAIASPLGNGEAPSTTFRVIDIPGYLDATVVDKKISAEQARKLRSWWEVNITGKGRITFCEEEEAHEILQSVYPSKERQSKTE